MAKVNELNKNVVILLSVLIIAVTSIVITLIATSDSGKGKGSADSLRQFQEYFVAEYGVKPNISVKVSDVTEDKAKEITKDLSKEYDLGGTMPLDTGSNLMYSTIKDGDISVFASYK